MLSETILRWVIEYGYIGIFSVLALGIIGAPIPDEGVLAFAGYLVYEGKLQVVPTMAAAFSDERGYSFCVFRPTVNEAERHYSES